MGKLLQAELETIPDPQIPCRIVVQRFRGRRGYEEVGEAEDPDEANTIAQHDCDVHGLGLARYRVQWVATDDTVHHKVTGEVHSDLELAKKLSDPLTMMVSTYRTGFEVADKAYSHVDKLVRSVTAAITASAEILREARGERDEATALMHETLELARETLAAQGNGGSSLEENWGRVNETIDKLKPAEMWGLLRDMVNARSEKDASSASSSTNPPPSSSAPPSSSPGPSTSPPPSSSVRSRVDERRRAKRGQKDAPPAEASAQAPDASPNVTDTTSGEAVEAQWVELTPAQVKKVGGKKSAQAIVDAVRGKKWLRVAVLLGEHFDDLAPTLSEAQQAWFEAMGLTLD